MLTQSCLQNKAQDPNEEKAAVEVGHNWLAALQSPAMAAFLHSLLGLLEGPLGEPECGARGRQVRCTCSGAGVIHAMHSAR
jgi:hypothetical protein